MCSGHFSLLKCLSWNVNVWFQLLILIAAFPFFPASFLPFLWWFSPLRSSNSNSLAMDVPEPEQSPFTAVSVHTSKITRVSAPQAEKSLRIALGILGIYSEPPANKAI